MAVIYKHTDEGWKQYGNFLIDLVINKNLKKICEIGGGANPSLPLAFIKEHQLDYTILDISSEELTKASEGYNKILCDITSDNVGQLTNDYDLVFSKMLAEHVKCGKKFHTNVRKILKKGGIAFHFFPTLFGLPFFINKLLPNHFSYQLLHLFSKERSNQGKHGKFPGFYSLCYGPTKKQIKLFESLGYTVDCYIGFFGHSYYKKIPLLNWFFKMFTKILLRFPISHLTSYSYVVLSKR